MKFEAHEIFKFRDNYNKKLDCKYFTTIRLHNPKKHQVGKIMGIERNGRIEDHAAKIIDIKTFYLKDMSEYMAGLDTGYSKAEAIEMIRLMYRHIVANVYQARFDFILLRREDERHTPPEEQLTFEEFRDKYV